MTHNMVDAIESLLNERPGLQMYASDGVVTFSVYDANGDEVSEGTLCTHDARYLIQKADFYRVNDEVCDADAFAAALTAIEAQPLTCTISDAIEFLLDEVKNNGGDALVCIGNAAWRVVR